MCSLYGLTARLGQRALVPTRRSVKISKNTNVLQLRVVTGRTLVDWHKQADVPTAAWRADRLTFTSTAPGELEITGMRGDVLAEPIACPTPTSGPSPRTWCKSSLDRVTLGGQFKRSAPVLPWAAGRWAG